jgi:hypothetical protein
VAPLAVSTFFLGLKAIPFVSIFFIILELSVLGGGFWLWFYNVYRHPIQVHIRLMRNAGKPWIKKGGRIVENADGTRSLKIIGVKKLVPCPELRFVHSNSTIPLFRRMRMYMSQDDVGDYHPLGITEFTTDFKPETQDMKFFYANMNRLNTDLFEEKKSWWKNNFGLIVGASSFLIAGVIVILALKYHSDFINGAGSQLAGAANNIASALSKTQTGG